MMSRPRLPIGTFGEFTYETTGTGRVRARTYFRDWDGTKRLIQASGATQAAAERALKVKLNERTQTQPQDTCLTPDSTFTQLVEYWLRTWTWVTW